MRRRLGTLGVALGLVVAQACAWVLSETPGNRVRIVLAGTRWPDDGTRPGALVRADGSAILIERAYVAWARAELRPCDGAPLVPLRDGAHAALFGGGVARASHGPTTRLSLRRTELESLVSHRAATFLELSPPSGRYCKLVVGVAAPEAATAGPADLDMRGVSLLLEGWQRASAAAPWRPFALRESAAFDVVVPLERELAEGEALEVTLSREADGWLAGLDLTAPDAARAALEGLQRATAATVR